MKKLVIILYGGVLLSAQAPPFAAGETLVYATGFRLFAAGKTTLQVLPPAATDTTLRLRSLTETGGFFDHLYSVRDRTNLWLKPQTLELVRMERDLNEGRYHHRDTTLVDRREGVIRVRQDTLAFAGPVFDPIGAIYYLRSLPLTEGQEIPLTIFDGRRLRQLVITVAGWETVTVPAGTFRCLALAPKPLDGQPLTKVDGMLKLWLADDERRTPVWVEQQANIGTMVLKLAEVR